VTGQHIVDLAWEWLDRPGLECARVELDRDTLVASGLVVTVFDKRPLRLAYELTCDSSWLFRKATIEIQTGDAHVIRQIEVNDATWRVDGSSRADLDGCVDIDIMGSPITNTLPVRRLTWRTGEMRELRMTYIRVPDLEVAPVLQRYTRLDDPGSSINPSQRFGYLAVASGFSAEVLVDHEGFVLHYPPVWQRLRWPPFSGHR
jgi:uncharacterized protein